MCTHLNWITVAMCSRMFAQKMASLASPCDRQDSQRKWRQHGCRSRRARPFWSGIWNVYKFFLALSVYSGRSLKLGPTLQTTKSSYINRCRQITVDRIPHMPQQPVCNIVDPKTSSIRTSMIVNSKWVNWVQFLVQTHKHGFCCCYVVCQQRHVGNVTSNF